MWKNTILIFSLVKNNKSMYFHYSFWITSIVFIVSLTDTDPALVFLTPLISLFLNKTIKYWYAFSYLECKEHFDNKIILICRNFMFLSRQRFMFKSTDRWCHDVHVLFGYVVMTSEGRIGMLTIK